MVKEDSLVVRTARALSGLSVAASDGAFLGSETDLLARLGISRPTLRQAAKIVESDKLITVRRGIGGGFFASRPAARDAIQSPALYLRMNGATIGHVHAVTRLIAEEAAAAAAACKDERLRADMRQLRSRIESDDVTTETSVQVIQRETEFARLLGMMSGNPVIALFMEIGYTFGFLSSELRFYQTPEDRRIVRVHQRELCDAILKGDADIARVMMRRRSDQWTRWIAEAGVPEPPNPVSDNGPG